ncbi:MAG: helix-turn-helix domain-containing protein, partial [Chloroflexota bacterium]|nr:helix-turn-helix domain-containing protein [Chloroflexota bacterium]
MARAVRPLRTLARGLAILECFSAQRPSLSHSEIVAAMGLPSGTVARFLQTLEALGYVAQTSARRYRLTVRALALTQGSLGALWLPEWLFPRLERLALETGEAWTVCVLDGCEVVCVSFGGGTILHGVMPLGLRTPAHRTGVGTAIIAFFDGDEREAALGALA